MNTIIIDLEGTLCDVSHRVLLRQAGMWEDFDEGLRRDGVNPSVWFLAMAALHGAVKIVLVTGRSEKLRPDTMAWLIEHKIFWDELLMRQAGDFSPEHELKPRLVEGMFGSRAEMLKRVGFVLDDADKCVEAWRNLGFNCWQVSSGG